MWPQIALKLVRSDLKKAGTVQTALPIAEVPIEIDPVPVAEDKTPDRVETTNPTESETSAADKETNSEVLFWVDFLSLFRVAFAANVRCTHNIKMCFFWKYFRAPKRCRMKRRNHTKEKFW